MPCDLSIHILYIWFLVYQLVSNVEKGVRHLCPSALECTWVAVAVFIANSETRNIKCQAAIGGCTFQYLLYWSHQHFMMLHSIECANWSCKKHQVGKSPPTSLLRTCCLSKRLVEKRSFWWRQSQQKSDSPLKDGDDLLTCGKSWRKSFVSYYS